jgi:chromosome segregation ATPase
LYKTVDNRKTLEQQNAMIAKQLDESLAARNKLYEANQQHHLELCDMKRQIKSLEEERLKLQKENSRLQKELQTAQACAYSVCCLDVALSIIITEISFRQVLQMTTLDW